MPVDKRQARKVERTWIVKGLVNMANLSGILGEYRDVKDFFSDVIHIFSKKRRKNAVLTSIDKINKTRAKALVSKNHKEQSRSSIGNSINFSSKPEKKLRQNSISLS
ncbi:MAG: hypothetical protein UU08_C0021G0002 [Candidatus Uhrbacteria bacterium GW2011_GWE2_40_58]|nr:MAG: hypothetical protein UT94_C0026G0002 [Candidatus Uhrbacteria bacterium GW2011_GWF2_40_263]KKR67290.1 MAG: hypothetical protein UU08_C0021G0002 [Candidatus Uhrbacteria bacterium GW2011_GWE2_40_58]